MFGKQKDKPVEASTNTGWFDLATLPRIFDITPQGFAKSVRPLIDVADIRNAGERGRVLIRARGAINAWVKHQNTRVAGGDPLLVAGGPSPALERYRSAKATQEELNLELRRRTHLDANEIRGELIRFAGVMRTAIEQVQREFGNPPADILSEALDETEKGWLSVIDAPLTTNGDCPNDYSPNPSTKSDHNDADQLGPATSKRHPSRSRSVQRRTGKALRVLPGE